MARTVEAVGLLRWCVVVSVSAGASSSLAGYNSLPRSEALGTEEAAASLGPGLSLC